MPGRFGVGAGVLLQVHEDARLDPDHRQWNTLVGNATRKTALSAWEILSNEWSRQMMQPPRREAIANALTSVLATA
jgi:hypothetical protein